MSANQGHSDEEREPDHILCICSGEGPFPGTHSIGFSENFESGYIIGRTRENAVGAKVIKKDGHFRNDEKQRWNLKDKQFFDLSNKLVLDIIDNRAVMQEPNDSSLWQKWKGINNGENIVSCHDPTICLQIADEGNGENVVIGPLQSPPAKYQTWTYGVPPEGF